jgi:hypothetical protein
MPINSCGKGGARWFFCAAIFSQKKDYVLLLYRLSPQLASTYLHQSSRAFGVGSNNGVDTNKPPGESREGDYNKQEEAMKEGECCDCMRRCPCSLHPARMQRSSIKTCGQTLGLRHAVPPICHALGCSDDDDAQT